MNQKKWLITGCSSGFGRAIAEAALGKNVVKKMRDKAAALTREVEQWGEVAVNTDFPI